MKRIALFIAALMGLGSIAHAQKYQMDVQTNDGLITSYLVNDMQDVTYQDGKTIITFGNKTVKTYDNKEIATVSWSENKGSGGSNAGSFTLDEDHLSVVTPDYSIEFSPTAIDKEMTLTVTKSSGTPNIMLDGVQIAVAYDFSLGNVHELDGVAVIRLPMEVSAGQRASAVYYNQEKAKWEVVNGNYDAATHEMVITTNHLSTYAGLKIENAMTRAAMMSYLWMPGPDEMAELSKLTEKLVNFIYSDDPDAAAIEAYGSQYSTVTQLGLDVGFNSLLAVGFGSELLEGFAEVLGRVGVALSVYNICRNAYSGDEAQLAGNTLKLCLQETLYWTGKFCGNAMLTASLAGVAFIDYTINKFATEAWSKRKDFYRNAMVEYYRKGGKGYRSAADWYKIMMDIFKRTDLTTEKIHQLVDEEVTRYSNAVWNDSEYLTWYEADKGVTFGYSGGQIVCKDLAVEKRGELYNGVLVSVFRFIGANKEQMAFDLAYDAMQKYVEELNKGVILQFVDNSRTDDKTESAYKGYTVRFKNLPKTIKDPKEWECTLDSKGEGKIEYSVIAAADAEIKPVLELVAPDEKETVVNEITLKDLKAGYTEKDKKNVINIAPTQIVGVLLAGNISCSAASFRKGEKYSMSPLALSALMKPGAIKVTNEGKKWHVDCFELLEDEADNVYVGSKKIISFDIDNVDKIATNEAKMSKLYFYFKSSFSSGGDLMTEQFGSANVVPEIPMRPGTHNIGAAAEDGDDDYFLADMVGIAVGAKYAKMWAINQTNGLKFSDYSLTRKEYVYEWDKEARKDVLDHIDTHSFSILDDPSNEIIVVLLFK